MLISSSSPSLNPSEQTAKPISTVKNSVSSVTQSSEKSHAAGYSLSGIAEFAYAMQVSELNYNHDETNLTYREDNSLALKASSTINFKLRTEDYRFDITLSAESLGLDASFFADIKKPVTIQLQYSQSQLDVSYKLDIKQVKTLRKPQEILQDLLEGITDALRDPDNKSIMYTLDEEAVASLIQSDAKMAKLFTELVMIMNMVNLMKKQNQESKDYVIHLSGKGKPYLDIKEELNGEELHRNYQINITIQPPQTDQENKLAEPSPQENTINTESPADTQDSPA